MQQTGAILEIGLRVGVIPLLPTLQPGFYSQRVQKPLQRTLPAVFCTKLRLIHRLKLV